MSMTKNILPNIALTGVEPISNDGEFSGGRNALHDLDLLRLSTEMTRLESGGLCPKGTSVLCGTLDEAGMSYRDWIATLGGNLMVLPDHNHTIEWLAHNAGRLDFVLVDVDWLGDVEDTVDFCIRLRHAVPGLPIILISSDVREDDFTAERMMACDATLKAPLSEARLHAAIQAGYENNAQYNRSRAYPQVFSRDLGRS